MATVSIVISAYNEEKKIKACLESASFADEVIFVDNSSTDDTAKIAKQYTKSVYTQKNDPTNIDLQKNFGIEKATGDWILILDGDEEITPELQEEIKTVIASEKAKTISGFWIPRKNIAFGKWIAHTGWYPDHQLRLFQKGKGLYIKKHYHEPVAVKGETGTLYEHIIHHNYENISQFLQKAFLVYTPNEAEALFTKGYVFDYKDAIRFPVKEFMSRYFAREGYKDGLHGLMLSFLMSMYHFSIFCYLWEKKKFPEKNIALKNIANEFHQSGKEISYWMNEKRVEEEKSTVKKTMLRIKNKFS